MEGRDQALKDWAARVVERTFTPERCDQLLAELMFSGEPRTFEGLEPTAPKPVDQVK